MNYRITSTALTPIVTPFVISMTVCSIVYSAYFANGTAIGASTTPVGFDPVTTQITVYSVDNSFAGSSASYYVKG